MNLQIKEFSREYFEECVDVFIDTFTKEPWYDTYESREQVVQYFNNFMGDNYFLGYIALLDQKVVALSIGMKKPWLQGMEYYIDQFCVAYSFQGKGIGSKFLKEIEELLKEKKLNGVVLNTEKSYPAYEFYTKNGFKQIDDLVVLGK